MNSRELIELKKLIEHLGKNAKSFFDFLVAIETEIEKCQNTIKYLNKKNKNNNYYDDNGKNNINNGRTKEINQLKEKIRKLTWLKNFIKDSGITDLSQLKENIEKIYNEDIKHAERLSDTENKTYYIFQGFDNLNRLTENTTKKSVSENDGKTVISISDMDAYKIGTNKLNKEKKYAIIIPIMDVIEGASFDDGENVYLENDYNYPEGTVLLVPKGEKRQIIDLVEKKGLKINVIDYDGEKIREIPQTFIRIIEGYDPEKLTIEDLNKEIEGLFDRSKEKYRSRINSNLIFVVQTLMGQNELIFSIEAFEEFLERFEINGKYESINELIKDALELNSDSTERKKEALQQLAEELRKNGIKCEESERLILKLYNISKIGERELKQLIQNEKIDSRIRMILLKNINKIENVGKRESETNADFFIKVFLEMLAMENEQLDLYIESKLSKKLTSKTDTNELNEFRELTNLIDKIYEQSASATDIYRAFQIGVYLLNKNKNKKGKKLCDEYDVGAKSRAIKYQGKKIRLVPRLKTADFLNAKRYYVKDEEKVITAARLLNLMNNLAHLYDSMIDELIISEFYENVRNKKSINRRKFLEKKHEIEHEVDNHITGIDDNNQQSGYDKFKELFQYRDDCYECKDKLIVHIIKEMNRQNEQKIKYLYGYVNNETGILIVIDVTGYEQIIVHIKQNKYDYSDIAGIVTRYPFDLIRGNYLGRNTMQLPFLALKGIDKRARRKIGNGNNNINVIIRNIFYANDNKEEAIKDVHKYLIRAGYSGEEIIKLLNACIEEQECDKKEGDKVK